MHSFETGSQFFQKVGTRPIISAYLSRRDSEDEQAIAMFAPILAYEWYLVIQEGKDGKELNPRFVPVIEAFFAATPYYDAEIAEEDGEPTLASVWNGMCCHAARYGAVYGQDDLYSQILYAAFRALESFDVVYRVEQEIEIQRGLMQIQNTYMLRYCVKNNGINSQLIFADPDDSNWHTFGDQALMEPIL